MTPSPVTLSVPPGSVSPAPAPHEPAPADAARRFDILVVDSDETSLRHLTRLFEHEGMRVRAMTGRAEATKALYAKLPDGLVSDIVLADGSGYDLVKRLRTLPGGETPAVLVTSPTGGFLDRVEAIHCGADGYFEKPVDAELLVRRLLLLLERGKIAPARILSVEDEPETSGVHETLQAAGYQVKTCADPHSFETDVSAFQPDLVIMDIVLPWLTGYDLARYLRQDERHVALPVLFLSTERQLQARLETARSGGDEHLLKPVPPALLLSTVAARIERARFLKSLIDRDGLTRLLTHTALLERARALVSQRGRKGKGRTAWVMLDLDRFKSINDTHGHPVGDRVLVALASLLRRRLRQSDPIGRYGGEEFVLLLDDLNADEAVRLVNRLRQDFEKIDHRNADGQLFHATFSAGVAMLDESLDLDGWRRAADDALYLAKGNGRNRVELASPGPD